MTGRKPGFTYFKSDVLKQEIAISDKTGKVFCSDGVTYSPEEMLYLKQNFGDFNTQIHSVKKIFGGQIVGIENKD